MPVVWKLSFVRFMILWSFASLGALRSLHRKRSLPEKQSCVRTDEHSHRLTISSVENYQQNLLWPWLKYVDSKDITNVSGNDS
jgi:hypothetical protein